MHIHLDAIGGIAGDMFVAAMLDCWPELAQGLDGQLTAAGFGELVELRLSSHNDGVLQGSVFQVRPLQETIQDPSSHPHRHYAEIRRLLAGSQLDESVKVHALGIFHALAEAEAAVHGMEVDEVVFHEVGAWDSIADIVSAAYLISASGVQSWSVSSLPLGGGQVNGSHGSLPLPAPAVTHLLGGFEFHDDGVLGERVTPTGAAILTYLQAQRPRPEGPRRLAGSGYGFGTKTFSGLSNVLRVTAFAASGEDQAWREERIGRLAFEIDDQNPEDLAVALEKIRAMDGVLDISQTAVQGKKQRSAIRVQVLVEPNAMDEVTAACFNETASIGLRREWLSRVSLPRLEVAVEIENEVFRAKVVQRPNGTLSVKAEMDDVGGQTLSYAEREALRQEIESLALDKVLEQYGE